MVTSMPDSPKPYGDFRDKGGLAVQRDFGNEGACSPKPYGDFRVQVKRFRTTAKPDRLGPEAMVFREHTGASC